jgi:hypothetical protein
MTARPGMCARALLCALGLSLVATERVAAQDSNYWSLQYGPVGQLVGGQLIGGVSDLSSTFYNPGSLALSNQTSYLLSSEAVQNESISTTSAGGPDIFDASSSAFGAAPSLLAGALPQWFGENTHLAWSFLTRQQLNLRLGQRSFDTLQGFQDSAAESLLDQRLTESWAGLTFSHKLSESSGVGVTWYGINRSQELRRELNAQAIGTEGRSLALLGVTDFKYSHQRTLLKLGYSFQKPAWDAGVSVTTPSIGVMGSARAAYTLSTSGIDANGDGRVDTPTLAAGSAEDLDADYRSSWAIGAGGSKRFGKTRVFMSAEWFAPVGAFTVVTLPEAASSTPELIQSLKGVFNAGLAAEHVLNEDISFYGAFHTDFTASKGTAGESVALSDLNLYHFSGGASFRIQGNRFTLGALYAMGNKTRALASPVPPTTAPGYNLDRPVDINYSKITLLLGFEFRK